MPAPPPPPTRTFVCSNCGSDQVVRDAWAEWSIRDQQWVFEEIFDHTFCPTCETECTTQAQETEPTPTEP